MKIGPIAKILIEVKKCQSLTLNLFAQDCKFCQSGNISPNLVTLLRPSFCLTENDVYEEFQDY